MKKLSVLFYAAAILGISIYGLYSQSYYIHQLINISMPYMIFRASVVLALMFYAFTPWIRVYETKALLGISGLVLITLGCISILSPSLIGHLQTWMLIGDDLLLIEGGILAVILSAELSVNRSLAIFRGFIIISSMLTIRYRKFIYSSLSHSIKNTQSY